ncbi:hypothetical protein [Desulforhopalus singaporensis]|uniref:Uncharacterized protein n=1 Tax=Desulforhopalus singaporensis TaxID=91360 RepID=A0A1H0LE32_9BACT|nr:hypothetical protein [Desulforhopalus singaporensis]SDO66241.1 hypothetical protein SAMN05660330_00763 [Desulforhopalus singaporensis]
MTSLVIHVGPGKCGSSSIQHFFATQQQPCIQKTCYRLLDPAEILKLNRKDPPMGLLGRFRKYLADTLKDCEVMIISHEFLFQCPHAVGNICKVVDGLFDTITIVGYCRRQSNFLISAYSQWLFRAPGRIREIDGVLAGWQIDSALFSGLERQLIACVADDFHSARQLSEYSILDWSAGYGNITRLIDDGRVVTKCGVLPGKDSGVSLIGDFCEKSQLDLRREAERAAFRVENVSFNQDIVEAISNGAAFGLDVPGPHEDNEVIALLSALVDDWDRQPTEFLSCLKAYTDTFYESSNMSLCRTFGLPRAYFAPEKRFEQAEIKAIIKDENLHRAANSSAVVNEYRMLSAKMIELCLKLAKNSR